jgi:hypothetical protein
MRAKGTRDQWRERVEAWRASGLTRAQFARKVKVHPGTLTWWQWKLASEEADRRGAQRQPEQPESRLAFVEIGSRAIAAVAESLEGRIELEVGRVTLRVPDQFRAETLARVLEVLEGRS